MAGNSVVLEAIDLAKHYPVGRGLFSIMGAKNFVKAVDGINFQLREGEILGLAGESGSGKSTTGEMIVRLIEPTNGKLLLDGHNLAHLKSEELKKFRNHVQMIFQDPYGTLNPRYSIYATIEEPLIIYGVRSKEERMAKVKQALEQAELRPAEKYMSRLPYELSGGERQRVAIARAIVLNPRVIVADEPVSMLDVSIRAGILDLLKHLRDELRLAMIYISHDLSTIRYLCDRTAIMYLGRLVEVGPTKEVMDNPKHPYTKLLLSSVPVPDPDYKREAALLPHELPDQINTIKGCSFAPRCSVKIGKCSEYVPEQEQISDNHMAACHLIK